MSGGILELPEMRERISRISVADYERMGALGIIERRTELIRGFIIQKMSRSPLHASIATRLFKKVLALLPPGFTARQEQPLRFLDSEPEPDIAVVAGDDRDFTRQHPTTASLIVEVAVSSVVLNRTNAALYAENGVVEYWIILAEQRKVEVFRNPQAGAFQEGRVYADDEELACAAVPELRVRVHEIFD
jgi:Uma2 family endonuclease